jgi:adenylate cyclase
MGRNIWVIGNDRQEMIEAQRRINSTGGMHAVCKLSLEAVRRSVQECSISGGRMPEWREAPSLIIVDYAMSQNEDFATVSYIKKQKNLAGVPLFFMTETRNKELDRECYSRGATVVLHKPFSQEGILRIEQTAWQHDVTKNYEKLLVQQANHLKEQEEIVKLNKQLEARNRLLHQVFGQYFSDDILNEILEYPEGAAIGGKKRELTVMMADLRGFTSISEGLSPEKVTDVLNFFFKSMLPDLIAHKGTVIEYLGDSILAVFGAPIALETQTENALAAAVKMQNNMAKVNEYCSQNGYPVMEMGIALHRGEAFIGNVGSEQMMRYNVIGSVVNECSRIESFCVGGQILASQECLDHVTVPVRVNSKQEILAKGMAYPMTVCEISGVGGAYDCRITEVGEDILYPVEKWVLFNMYPIEGKLIQDVCVTARLCEFSHKRAVVMLEEPQDYELCLGMDVEIFAAADNGKALFTETYAKIIEKKDSSLTLCFTHVNRSFQSFAGQLWDHIERD